MRVAISLMVMTLLTLLLAAASVADAEPLAEVPFDDARDLPIVPESTAPQGTKFVTEDIQIDFENLWADNGDEDTLVFRLVRGIMRSRTLVCPKDPKTGKRIKCDRKVRWERCGRVLEEEELIPEALVWVGTLLESIKEVKRQANYDLNVWGAFAVMANESGFNECALNFKSRKWAAENGLVDKFRQSYTRDEIWDVITSDKWRSAKMKKADFGPWQRRFRVHKLNRPEFDRLLSIHPGIYDGAREMARRAKDAKQRYRLEKPHPRPWLAWPGWNINAPRNLKYDQKITMVARWLGAWKHEI